MILVDTGIIIDFWKRPTQEDEKVFLNEDVAVCGVVMAELIRCDGRAYTWCKKRKGYKRNQQSLDWLQLHRNRRHNLERPRAAFVSA